MAQTITPQTKSELFTDALPVSPDSYDPENGQTPVRLEFDSTSSRNITANTQVRAAPAMGAHVCVVTAGGVGTVLTLYDAASSADAVAANAVCSIDATQLGPVHVPHVFARGVYIKSAAWSTAVVAVGVI